MSDLAVQGSVYCPQCAAYTLPCRGQCLFCGCIVAPGDLPKRAKPTRNRKRRKREKPEPEQLAYASPNSHPCTVTGCKGTTRWPGSMCAWHRQKAAA